MTVTAFPSSNAWVDVPGAAKHKTPQAITIDRDQTESGPMEVEVPSGQPLGLGGLPFESTELELAEGTVIALYTDGLIEARDRDVDAGQDLLARALSGRTGSLDDICQEVVHSLLPANGAPDDVALLLARTRGLKAEQVANESDEMAQPSSSSPRRTASVTVLARFSVPSLR